MSLKNCTNCSAPLEGDAAFCGNCGTPVRQATAPPSTPKSSSHSRKNIIPAVIAAVVMGLCALGAGAYFLFPGLVDFLDIESVEPSEGKQKTEKRVKPANLQFVSMDTSTPEESEKVLQDGKKLPIITAFSAESNIVEPTSVIPLLVALENPENAGFSLYYDSSCGIVTQHHRIATMALFVAPDTPGRCSVTVEVRSANMLASVSKTIGILISAQDGAEVRYDK